MTSNSYPTPHHFLLLQAGLLKKETAKKAWNIFTKHTDLQDMDPVSYSLLPLVYQNMRTAHGETLHIPKSIYKHTWALNSRLIAAANRVSELLASHNIPSTFIKGAALLKDVYQDIGARVIGDVDILIPLQDAKKAACLLFDAGWISTEGITKETIDGFIRRTHALLLKHPDGNVIDLHWHALEESGLDELLASFPKNVPVSIEDHLLHTLFHGTKFSPFPLIRWVADATKIVETHPQLDWDLFFEEAERLRIRSIIDAPLHYLQRHQFASIPRFKKHQGTPFEKKYMLYHNRKRSVLLAEFYDHYYALKRTSTSRVPLLRLPQFIMQKKALRSWRELFAFSWHTLKKKSRHLFFTR